MGRRTRNTKKKKTENVSSFMITANVDGKEIGVGFINLNDRVAETTLDDLEGNPEKILKWLAKFKIEHFEERESYENSVD